MNVRLCVYIEAGSTVSQPIHLEGAARGSFQLPTEFNVREGEEEESSSSESSTSSTSESSQSTSESSGSSTSTSELSSSSSSTSPQSESSASSLSSQSTSSQSLSSQSTSSSSESSLSSSSPSSLSSSSPSSLSSSSPSSQSESSQSTSSQSGSSGSSISSSQSSSSGEFASIEFQVRNLPTPAKLSMLGDTEDDWPWRTPKNPDGTAAVSPVPEVSPSDCIEFPVDIFNFEQVRLVCGIMQYERRYISIYLAG